MKGISEITIPDGDSLDLAQNFAILLKFMYGGNGSKANERLIVKLGSSALNKIDGFNLDLNLGLIRYELCNEACQGMGVGQALPNQVNTIKISSDGNSEIWANNNFFGDVDFLFNTLKPHSGSLKIGNSEYQDDGHFNGTFDEILIYSRSFSAEELQQFWN